MTRSRLPALLLLLLPTALAQTPAAPATSAAPAAATPAAPAAPLTVSADLRDEYLAGQDMLVEIAVQNPGAAPVTVPDLSARPWRVRFRFTLPSGQAQERFNTPPAQEPTTSWTIPARGQKRVLLAVPSGATLKEGSYTLSIEVDLGAQKETLPARPVRVAVARPVAGRLAVDALPPERSGLSALWQHQVPSGVDLFLAQADARAPEKSHFNSYLIHLDRDAPVRLSAARPGETGSRYVFWAAGDRAIGYLRLQGSRIEGAARQLELPWPKSQIAGQGATDGRGNLHVPVWIPAPRGAGGELRLASVDERGRPQLRRMATLTSRPGEVRATVDVSGGVHLLVPRGDKLDLYTLRADYPADLPVPGERLWAAETGQVLREVRFGSAVASAEHPGGLAALAVWEQGGNVEAQWLSLQGKALQKLPGTPIAKGTSLLDVLPRGNDAPGLLLKLADGSVRYVEGAAESALPALPTTWGLVRDATGRALLLSLEPGVGVRYTPLAPEVP